MSDGSQGDAALLGLLVALGTAALCYAIGPIGPLLGLLGTTFVLCALSVAYGVRTSIRYSREYPLRLQVVMAASWVDGKLTGVKWYRRDYAVRAWRRWSPRVTGKSIAECERLLSLMRAQETEWPTFRRSEVYDDE